MTRFLSGMFLFLMPLLAYADTTDPPVPTEMNWIGITIFLVLSVGACVAFFVLIWTKDGKKDKQDGTEQK